MNEQTTTFNVTGLGCMGCVNTVQNGLSKLEGVKSAEVKLEVGQATVTYDPNRVTLEDLRGRVVAVGYGVDGVEATHHCD